MLMLPGPCGDGFDEPSRLFDGLALETRSELPFEPGINLADFLLAQLRIVAR